MTVEEQIEELKTKLTSLQNAEATIINGGVRKFGKGDTSYTMLSLEEINKMIAQTKNQIKILESKQNVCV